MFDPGHPTVGCEADGNGCVLWYSHETTGSLRMARPSSCGEARCRACRACRRAEREGESSSEGWGAREAGRATVELRLAQDALASCRISSELETGMAS